jgi:hypothetical protein
MAGKLHGFASQQLCLERRRGLQVLAAPPEVEWLIGNSSRFSASFADAFP